MKYEITLTNSSNGKMILDEAGYSFFTTDPRMVELNILSQIRKHSISGAGFFQKWHKNKESGKLELQTIYLHRLLAETFLKNSMPSETHRYVTHLNGDSLDNRLSNLGWATWKEINRKRTTPGSKTGYRGVIKAGKKFRAVYYVNNKQILIGSYQSAEDAAQAYNNKMLDIGYFKTAPNIIGSPVYRKEKRN